MSSVRTFQADRLTVKCYATRAKMGEAAATEIRQKILELIAKKPTVNIVFAAAPSQNEVLAALVVDSAIPWSRINAFHMDEYIGLSGSAPQSFGNFLKKHIFDKVPFRSVSYLNGQATDVAGECRRYATLLQRYPTDIVCMGVGENGHIAFNDPPVADFSDKKLVKKVQLDPVCREQQVHDGCFSTLDKVPTYALTLTVPALMSASSIFCVVPALTKAPAVRALIRGPISEACPASILRCQNNATLYLDGDSGSLL